MVIVWEDFYKQLKEILAPKIYDCIEVNLEMDKILIDYTTKRNEFRKYSYKKEQFVNDIQNFCIDDSKLIISNEKYYEIPIFIKSKYILTQFQDFNKIRNGEWYLLFREADDDLLCGYRMYLHVRNCMVFNMISNTIHKEASDAYRGTTARKNNIFLNLIKEVKEDSECGSHKKEINKALYDFSFIYKIDKDARLSEVMEALDDEEIKVFDKLCRKIAKLNESTMSLPRNFRSLSLNTCYLKSLLIVMPLLMSNKILNQINSEDTTDKEKCGYIALQSLIKMSPELKRKYNRKDFTLKRNF